jgi:hypothetical protein
MSDATNEEHARSGEVDGAPVPHAPVPLPPPGLMGPLPGMPRSAPIHLSLSADGLLLLGVASWLLWRRFLRAPLMRRFGVLLGSQESERYVTELLAQAAILTGASRVVLGTFYSGRVTATGYSFTRVSILSCYTAPGRLPLDLQMNDLPIERISADLDELLNNGAGSWRYVEAGSHLPAPCLDYLQRNRIAQLYGRLILLEGLPIGVLNLHFDHFGACPVDPAQLPHADRLELLFLELSRLLRERILRPPLWRRLFNAWAGQ